ncbi:HypC/HybG/HupF family hydrogenase formation chaperone [Pseudonocardia sp.]|uniref:HypC/HybG/HupF family hydrogenase formation chaperone n=1 Tax=Pseudonocardia sp. TaxID=60912 RepID=UPI00262EC10B|nr:HypC/HybG/HupF family hydrogenase formation chaperone [Pseudonocardia sp.]
MCLGIPGRVIGPMNGHPDLAVVRVEGVDRPVNLGLLDGEPTPGEWVLIHMGFALERIDEATAKASLEFVTGRDGAFGDRPG